MYRAVKVMAWVVFSPLLLPLWAYEVAKSFCRLTAKKCPNCGERWFTELVGEWDCEEDWHCHRCGQYWSVNE